MTEKSPMALIVPYWDRLSRGEKAALTKSLKKHLAKLRNLPPTDPRFLEHRRRLKEAERILHEIEQRESEQ
jgi:hypothetical protein